MNQNISYTVRCPICRAIHMPRPKMCWDEWHDMFVCCRRIFDVCCQEEFKRLDWLRVVAKHAQNIETVDSSSPL